VEGDERVRAVSAPVIVTHVIPRVLAGTALFTELGLDTALIPGDLAKRVRGLIEERVEALTGRKRGEYQLLVEEGSPHMVIVEQAERRSAGLVVVGGTGTGGFARALLGSVSERVVRHVHCPAVVARPSTAGGPVLAGTDFSDPTLPALRAGLAEARRLKVKLMLCHFLEIAALVAAPPMEALIPLPADSITNLERSARERLVEAAQKIGASDAELHVGIGEPGRGLVELAEKRGAGLVVVGTHGRTGLARVFMGSVAERVVRHAPCSVQVVRLH